MKNTLSSALRVACALFFFLRLVEGSNGTTSYTGWQDGPDERGTMTILWSCLTTIFACTWTILHLNVPHITNGTWTKYWRKTKWMAVTVIFPEFIFAKAVFELQMAIEDLHELKKQEDNFGWKVEYGPVCRLLYWIYHPYKESLSKLPTTSDSSKTWTLTHSYFANMGGMIVENTSKQHMPVTAHALVECCVSNKHNPFKHTRLTKEEILDKSKADNLLKAVAALQILYLIVSVITRKIHSLPISPLEVCTVAFASLSIATYVANLAKPKDVEVPFIVYLDDDHSDASHSNKNHSNNNHSNGNHSNDTYNIETHRSDIQMSKLCGQSFFARTVKPTGQHGPTIETPRIRNDMLRLQADGTQHTTLTYAIVVSTMCFGAIHLAAWRNYFPSEVERTLWQVASVLSTTLPLGSLLALSVSSLMLGKKAHEARNNLDSIMNPPLKQFSGPNGGLDSRTTFTRLSHGTAMTRGRPVSQVPLTRVRLSWKDGVLCVENKLGDEYRRHCIEKSIRSLLEVKKGLDKGSASQSWCTKYIYYWEELSLHSEDIIYEWDETPEHVSYFMRLNNDGIITSSDIPEGTMTLILEALNNSRETMAKLSKEWWLLIRWVDRMSSTVALLLAFLYATVRLILLAVAFEAFRKQDERLYVDTWARFLPSIG